MAKKNDGGMLKICTYLFWTYPILAGIAGYLGNNAVRTNFEQGVVTAVVVFIIMNTIGCIAYALRYID